MTSLWETVIPGDHDRLWKKLMQERYVLVGNLESTWYVVCDLTKEQYNLLRAGRTFEGLDNIRNPGDLAYPVEPEDILEILIDNGRSLYEGAEYYVQHWRKPI